MDTRGCCHQYFLLSLVIFVMINVHISVPPPPRLRRGEHKNIIDTFIYKISGDNSIYDIIYVITRTRLKKSHIYVLISIY